MGFWEWTQSPQYAVVRLILRTKNAGIDSRPWLGLHTYFNLNLRLKSKDMLGRKIGQSVAFNLIFCCILIVQLFMSGLKIKIQVQRIIKFASVVFHQPIMKYYFQRKCFKIWPTKSSSWVLVTDCISIFEIFSRCLKYGSSDRSNFVPKGLMDGIFEQSWKNILIVTFLLFSVHFVTLP